MQLPSPGTDPGLTEDSVLTFLRDNPGLLQQLRALQQAVHRPAAAVWDNTDIVVTSGSQDGLCKTLEMMISQGELCGAVRCHVTRAPAQAPAWWWRTSCTRARCPS